MGGLATGPPSPPLRLGTPRQSRGAPRLLQQVPGELLRVVAGRVVALVPVVFGVTLLVFLLNALALGDPARAAMGQRGDPEVLERIRREYALDRPLAAQYGAWMGKLARGALGHSYHQQRPGTELIAERAPATLRLAVVATLISVIAGVTMGALAARR